MERIKRFLLDETATAEAVSTVVMVAGVGVLLSVALGVYYGAFKTFFDTVGGAIGGWGAKVPLEPFS